jgi:RNA polymerase sigma factor (sigma-70 family)
MRQVLQYLRRVAGSVAGADSDAQLLREYAATRAEEPFAALVRRHGAMVLGVCRRVLGESGDADDAFQTTFLVLAKKAGAGGWRESVGRWLAAVAYRIASKHRVARARRAAHEQQVARWRTASTEENPALREVEQILAEELDRLPEKFRLPVLLCCLQDLTTDEAARQLGWSFATVKGRLQRGRERLRERLRQRGVTLPAGVLATILAERAVRGVPPALVQTTVTAAVSGISSARVAALVEVTIATLFWNRVIIAVLVLAVVGLVGLWAGLWIFRTMPEVKAVPAPENLPLAEMPPTGPVIVVTASFPGADGQLVAGTVANNIETQLEGVKGLVRIESKSDNHGQYTAHLYFKAKTDPAKDMVLVQNRVVLAERRLPEAVRKEGVTIKVGEAEADSNKVAIVIINRGDDGWEGLQKVAGPVVKRLADALTKPEVFPGDEKLVEIDIDLVKCDKLGVTPTEVCEAMKGTSLRWSGEFQKGDVHFGNLMDQPKVPASAMEVERFKKVVVRDKVTLGDVTIFRYVYGAAAVYCVDGFPAIRITGAPPEGKFVASAAARCVEFAEAELNRGEFRSFVVKNLSAK